MPRDETPLLTLENPPPFAGARPGRRMVRVGGLDGDPVAAARIVLDAVRWVKAEASEEEQTRWTVSAFPRAHRSPAYPYLDHAVEPHLLVARVENQVAGLPRRRARRVPSETNVAPVRCAGRRGRGRFPRHGARASVAGSPWQTRRPPAHNRDAGMVRDTPVIRNPGGSISSTNRRPSTVDVFYGVCLRVREVGSANMRPPFAVYDALECTTGDPHLSRQLSLADAAGGVPGANLAHKLINELCVRVCLPTSAGLTIRVDRVLRVVSAAYRHKVTGFDARRVVAEMARDFVPTEPPTELAFQHKPAQRVVSPPHDEAPVSAGVSAALRDQAVPVPHGPAEFVFDCFL